MERTMQYQRVEFRKVGWRGTLSLILAAALGLGLVVALLTLSVGIAIVLLPIIGVASLIGWFRWKRAVAAAGRAGPGEGPNGDGRTIEIDYRVIDGEDRRR
jgi:hypothetical protein